MTNLNLYYKEVINYKIGKVITYKNLFKKIRSFEDFLYALGLIKFALTKIIFKNIITNETVRGR
jgi:hypothetical protein